MGKGRLEASGSLADAGFAIGDLALVGSSFDTEFKKDYAFLSSCWAFGRLGYMLTFNPRLQNFKKRCEAIEKDATKTAAQKGIAKTVIARCEGSSCFTPNTPIFDTKLNAFKPIKKAEIGDEVGCNIQVTQGKYAKIEKNQKILYLALDSEVNPDPYTSADQKALDKLDYSSIEMQKVTLTLKKSLLGDLGVANGTVSEIQLLRPTAWLERNDIAEKGKNTYLNLPEMGLEGYATVTDLAHFRVTKSNTASEEEWSSGLVTGVFKHIANGVYHLRYDNHDSLGVTGTHPLYSLDRQKFIPTEDIKVGEHLLSKSGIITVVSKTYDATPQEVYNLEVGQWHNFLVGVSGVVAHNGPCVSPARRTHILDGDVGVPGSGHGPNRGNTQGVFPNTWTDDQCIEAIERVANSPTSTWKQATGPGSGVSAPTNIGGPHPNAASTTNGGGPVRFKIQNNDHGIKIEVIIEPNGEGIITGYVK